MGTICAYEDPLGEYWGLIGLEASLSRLGSPGELASLIRTMKG